VIEESTDEQDEYLESEVQELSNQALSVIRSREFFGVPRDGEERTVADAKSRCDLMTLQAMIDYGSSHQVGCVHRAATALREASFNGDDYRISLEHVEAAALMIGAVISVMRDDLSPPSVIQRQAYTEITDYGVIHHEDSHRIATIVRERKVSSLRELLIVLNGMRELEAGVLGEGFI
jgi:hypothetical protein